MDTKTLVVGQEVILFGVGRVLGTVRSVVSVYYPWIDVHSTDEGFLQFDENGKETDFSRHLRCGAVLNGPCPSLGPWEITDATQEEIAELKALGEKRTDTTKFKVGQTVQLQSGPRTTEATVTRITKEYIQVEPDPKHAIWFTPDGKRQWQCFGYGPDASDPRPVCTKFGPWELVDEAP